MWLIFLFGFLLGISVIIISLFVRLLYVMGNSSSYPGLEDVS